jgi:hypothetical protein
MHILKLNVHILKLKMHILKLKMHILKLNVHILKLKMHILKLNVHILMSRGPLAGGAAYPAGAICHGGKGASAGCLLCLFK